MWLDRFKAQGKADTYPALHQIDLEAVQTTSPNIPEVHHQGPCKLLSGQSQTEG